MTDEPRAERGRGAIIYFTELLTLLNYLNYEKDYRVFHRRGDVEH